MKREQARSQRDGRWQKLEWRQDIPIRYEADIAVIGGGIAGVCAACAAAASGVSVILVERFAATGGVLTTGGVANFSGDTRELGEVFEEILKGLSDFHALGALRDSAHHTKEQLFDHEVLAFVLQELLVKRGVKTLLHTRFVDVVVRDGVISEIVVCGQSGPEALRAKVFIDCTGEGQLAYMADFATAKGRESDGKQISMSMMAFVRHVEESELNDRRYRGDQVNKVIEHVRFPMSAAWIERVESEDALPMVSIWPNGPRSNALKIKVAGYDSTDTESITEAEQKARRRTFQIVDFYQRHKDRPWVFDHFSPIIGIREGRRIIGDYVLTEQDVRGGREFPDGVARGTWYLDSHSPDSDKRVYDVQHESMEVPPYQIPLRSLIARDGRNLLMAGRCLSADAIALSSARVSPSGAMMGQAVGIAAALSVRHNGDVRRVDATEVRRTVIERGGNLSV